VTLRKARASTHAIRTISVRGKAARATASRSAGGPSKVSSSRCCISYRRRPRCSRPRGRCSRTSGTTGLQQRRPDEAASRLTFRRSSAMSDRQRAAPIGHHGLRKADSRSRRTEDRTQRKIANCSRPLRSFDETLRPSFDFLANPCNLWASERLEHKKAALKLAFADRLTYVRNEGFRTPDLALPFKVLADVKSFKANWRPG
jgi:hypothetical protein